MTLTPINNNDRIEVVRKDTTGGVVLKIDGVEYGLVEIIDHLLARIESLEKIANARF